MKFILSSLKLLKAVQSLAGVINSSNTLPILDDFLFNISENALKITASDLETTMIVTIQPDMHGATVGRKLDVMRANPKVFFEIDCDLEPFEGSVACQYGISYSSVMGRGTAEILDNPQDKMAGLTCLMKTQTGKDFEFNERLVSAVSVFRINVSEFTAKHRPLPIAVQKAKENDND